MHCMLSSCLHPPIHGIGCTPHISRMAQCIQVIEGLLPNHPHMITSAPSQIKGIHLQRHAMSAATPSRPLFVVAMPTFPGPQPCRMPTQGQLRRTWHSGRPQYTQRKPLGPYLGTTPSYTHTHQLIDVSHCGHHRKFPRGWGLHQNI